MRQLCGRLMTRPVFFWGGLLLVLLGALIAGEGHGPDGLDEAAVGIVIGLGGCALLNGAVHLDA